jgi:hypothetical protein
MCGTIHDDEENTTHQTFEVTFVKIKIQYCFHNTQHKVYYSFYHKDNYNVHSKIKICFGTYM